MTTATRDRATGRFTTRHPTCASCGRIQHENLTGGLLCAWDRCPLHGQITGHTGADVGSLNPRP